MKTQNFISMIVFSILFTSGLFAKVWTVDNKSGSVADFNEIYDALNVALDGDSIYVYSSGSSSYSSVTVLKKVNLFGPGYFLSENPNTQTDTRPAKCRGFLFRSGSEGSLLSGFEITDDYDDINIDVDNIIIKRNKIIGTGAGLVIQSGHSNIIIMGNYFSNTYTRGNIVLDVGSDCNNIQINNNYLYSEVSNCIKAESSSAIDVWNNVLSGNVEIYNSHFYNNILISGTLSGTNSPADINHNIGNADQFGTSNGNQENVLMNSVFLLTGSTDGQWQLKGASTAIGAGLNGEDCGMFGGSTPYILSGLPAIPTIYFFIAPSSASDTNGLQVQIKAKSNN